MAEMEAGVLMAKRVKKAKVVKAPTRQPNPCYNAPLIERTYPDTHYGLNLPFKPSNAQLVRYAEYHNHLPQRNWKTGAPTFDDDALRALRVKYPSDPLYPLIETYREVEKAKGTYVDGLSPDKVDNKVRGSFSHLPSTLRLSMKPSLQTMPRGDDKDSVYALIKGMFEAGLGKIFYARDFSSIEGVLTGYFANDKNLVRLAGGDINDVHGYIATTVLNDVPNLNASDADVAAHLREYKNHGDRVFKVNGVNIPYKNLRTGCKRGFYLSIYAGTPHRMQQSEPGIFETTKVAEWYQDMIFSTFPSIRKWQWAVCEEADTKGYITTPDGFRQHFSDVFEYSFSKRDNRWVKKFGDTAKACISAKPQHCGMLYGALALVDLWENHRDVAEGLRLMIHDELFGEWNLDVVEYVDSVMQMVMEKPCELFPLPPEWNQGEFLRIKTEAKRGRTWREMW